METINKIILQDYQSRMFLLMHKDNLNIVEGIDKFMTSSLAKEIDSDFSAFHLFSPNIWLETLKEEVRLSKIDNLKYPLEAIEWLGYFYRNWHFITHEPSFKINRYLSALEGIKGYYTFHQLDAIDAINKIKNNYNLNRNSHRKYEFKKNINVICNANLEDSLFRSYLAKKIIYKLINDENVNNLYFSKEDNMMISKDKKISLISSLIYKDEFIDDYNFTNSKNHNYLFTFIKLKNNDINSIEDKKILEKIKHIKDSSLLNNYDFVYFYVSGILYEINDSNEISKYYLPISNRDLISIKKEIELYKIYSSIEKEIKEITY